ncbi:hypothetical protein F5X99DRAFT_399200 [Biscogniauxia marginata]|nr:hypothetical protein F5X99DRAFT_399200 [Biscogniauxia marginata]
MCWVDFEALMTHCGFSIYDREGGRVSFEPEPGAFVPNGKMGNKVVFHSPHKTKSICLPTSRCWGRTLTKQFGWTGDMFVER